VCSALRRDEGASGRAALDAKVLARTTAAFGEHLDFATFRERISNGEDRGSDAGVSVCPKEAVGSPLMLESSAEKHKDRNTVLAVVN
jgi:hypothetical protein